MKAFSYKLRPSLRVVRVFEAWLDVCRELTNAAIQERRDAWRMNRVSVRFADQADQLPTIKAVRPDVWAIHSQVLQDALRRVQKSFDAFFRRVKSGEKPGFPRFKSRNRFQSFTFPQSGFRLEGKKLHLSKIGSVPVFLSRPLEGTVKTCTIRREADGWYVVFACETTPTAPLPVTGKACGIDLGIETFARLDDGSPVENPRLLAKAERRLKTAQRKVSRRKRGGSNRRMAVGELARQHLKLMRTRRDFQFKTAKRLVETYDRIAVEDLNIKGMVKNHHLAKAIHDAAWHQFISILTAKAEEAGRVVVKVNPRFTSQNCARCGDRVRKSLSEREHRCVACGFLAHRDHNSAINILARGHRVWGGAPLGASMNQEPARL